MVEFTGLNERLEKRQITQEEYERAVSFIPTVFANQEFLAKISLDKFFWKSPSKLREGSQLSKRGSIVLSILPTLVSSQIFMDFVCEGADNAKMEEAKSWDACFREILQKSYYEVVDAAVDLSGLGDEKRKMITQKDADVLEVPQLIGIVLGDALSLKKEEYDYYIQGDRDISHSLKEALTRKFQGNKDHPALVTLSSQTRLKEIEQIRDDLLGPIKDKLPGYRFDITLSDMFNMLPF